MQNFSQNNMNPGFYLSPCGYKMALIVLKSSIGGFFCKLALLPGEYDDTLEWPFQGEVSVVLLNQKENKDHIKGIIHFHENTPGKYKNRVITPKPNGKLWGNCLL